ncbi:MAG: hypothetical protein V3S22_02165 [Candidatus Neomarinimicrobiota bacterium]
MFSNFTEIIIVTFLGFAILYPLFLWIAPLKKINLAFYRFNLGLSCVTGALAYIFFRFLNPPIMSSFYMLVWLGLLLALTAIYWRKDEISNLALSGVSLMGVITLFQVEPILIPMVNIFQGLLMIVISSSILASVFFTLILGHWYLNAVHLPISLMKKSILVLSGLLILRLAWDLVQFQFVSYSGPLGIEISLLQFLGTFQGFLLAAALFLGIFIPLLLNIMIWRTLKLQAVQSATGLIYVSTVALLFGDLFFKFYMFSYGFLL